MIENNYNFSCTSYDKIDSDGNTLNQVVRPALRSDYEGVLKRCPGNSTVMYNAYRLGKFKIPNIRKRNDYVLWLQILKKEKHLYGLDKVLSSHRSRKGSLSSCKVTLIKYHWRVYRDIERLSVVKSVYLLLYWVLASVLRR